MLLIEKTELKNKIEELTGKTPVIRQIETHAFYGKSGRREIYIFKNKEDFANRIGKIVRRYSNSYLEYLNNANKLMEWVTI